MLKARIEQKLKTSVAADPLRISIVGVGSSTVVEV